MPQTQPFIVGRQAEVEQFGDLWARLAEYEVEYQELDYEGGGE